MPSHCDARDLVIRSRPSQPNLFRCRLCKRYHALRKCQAFLKMSVEKRLRAVLLFNYCPNCLAHEHSARSCLQNTGCHICTKNHHTLLHFNELYQNSRNNDSNGNSRLTRRHGSALNRRSNISSTDSNVSISSILSRHMVSLLPTANVIVISNKNRHSARALIDACSTYSRIEKQLAESHQLKTYKINNETYAQLMLTSKVDPQMRVAIDARICPRLTIKTPSKSLNSSIITKFSHLMLADTGFYTSQGISIILGNDTYSKIFKTGVIPGENGLPLAQDTVFGWVLSGSCAH